MSSWLAGPARDWLTRSRETLSQAATSAQQLAQQAELDQLAASVGESLRVSAQSLANRASDLGDRVAEHADSVVDRVASGASALGHLLLEESDHAPSAMCASEAGPPGELAQLFHREAQALTATLPRRGDAQSCAEVRDTLLRWGDRLEGTPGSILDAPEEEGVSIDAASQLRALLQSRALQLLLRALVGIPALHSVLRSAACADEAIGSQRSTMTTGALLLDLLARASTTDPALLAELLALLADSAQTFETGPADVVSQDVRWVLTLISTALTDFREVELLSASTVLKSVDRALRNAGSHCNSSCAGGSSSSSSSCGAAIRPSLDDSVTGIAVLDTTGRSDVGPAVTAQDVVAIAAAGDGKIWANWPGDGRWYRAHFNSVVLGRVHVSYIRQPANVPCVAVGESPEYLNAAGGDDTSFMEIGLMSIKAISESRPQPTHHSRDTAGRPRDQSSVIGGCVFDTEESWSQHLAQIHVLSKDFVELRELRDKVEISGYQRGAGLPGGAPLLADAASSLEALRQENDRHAAALGESVDSVSDCQSSVEEMQASTAGFRDEVGDLQRQLTDADRQIQKLNQEREELKERLQAVNERLALALADRGELAESQRIAQGKIENVCEEFQRHAADGEQREKNRISRRRLLEHVTAASLSIEASLMVRADFVAVSLNERGRLGTSGPVLAQACLACEFARGRCLQELLAGWHAAIWGPEASAFARDKDMIASLRSAHLKVSTLVEHAWRETVQLAAEELDAGENVSEDMSRAAGRYKEMRKQIGMNLERLRKLESQHPMSVQEQPVQKAESTRSSAITPSVGGSMPTSIPRSLAPSLTPGNAVGDAEEFRSADAGGGSPSAAPNAPNSVLPFVHPTAVPSMHPRGSPQEADSMLRTESWETPPMSLLATGSEQPPHLQVEPACVEKEL